MARKPTSGIIFNKFYALGRDYTGSSFIYGLSQND